MPVAAPAGAVSAAQPPIAGLCCPVCRSSLGGADGPFDCAGCGRRYPVIEGVPRLIAPDRSVFSADPPPAPRPGWAARLTPSLSSNPVSRRNYGRFVERLVAEPGRARVLVLGGAAVGQGLSDALQDRRVDWIETDVFPSPRTVLLCDAHQIPFENCSFDAVVAQALLEHTLDPQRVVGEIERVLRPGGLVYAETPFIQQVHAGAYDFTRWTLLGHRRLFRFFEEIDSGPACGPGMALAWSWQGFLSCFARGSRSRRLATLAGRLSAFWLKYLDAWLVKTPGALDCASSFYFLGRLTETPIDDRALIASYRGLQ